ncbi:NUDIX domain-containing protein [Christiangramia gaetbulicola]|uniref:NUDIX domain-containing protein n=1 Tax=Christiangramia gaetbulicola TaxID=703340 RepID=A0A2T6AE76_9FLAO|nr:NUDIX domain-containing protein [Christiangramia gaetbulicola]PTX42125.1 NUDIX domain-containing protein [Christiangramia gaetbulicola]
MYKVFVNDIPIIVSTQKEIGEKYTSFPLKTVRLKKVIKKILNGELMYVNLYHADETKLLKLLLKKMKVVTAAGGMVVNDKEEILFIYRNHRWDLPKGKTEKNESIEDSAIREVEEETGVQDLEIKRFITRTYHVFKRKGKLKLKETYWYEMYTEYDGDLVPELSEGIKKAKWKNFEKSQKALKKSYANIKMLFPEKYLAGKSEDRVA